MKNRLRVIDTLGHVYGGGLVLAIGAGMAYPPAGLISLGALLLYIGLRRP